MKRGLFSGVFIFLFLINFVNAQSFSETFSFLDPTMITLAVVFVVFFGALYFSVSKIFRGQTQIAAVIAIALSFLLVYWLNNLTDIGSLFSGWGISNEILYTAGPILFLAVLVLLIIKIRFGAFMFLGGLMILIGAMGLVYSTDVLMIIGAVFVAIGLLWMVSRRGRIFFLRARYSRIQRRNPRDIRLNKIANDLVNLGYEARKISY